MEVRTVYVYNKEELASAIYEASNYAVVTEIKYGTSAFSVRINGKTITNKAASKLEKAVKRSSNKIWKNI